MAADSGGGGIGGGGAREPRRPAAAAAAWLPAGMESTAPTAPAGTRLPSVGGETNLSFCRLTRRGASVAESPQRKKQIRRHLQ